MSFRVLPLAVLSLVACSAPAQQPSVLPPLISTTGTAVVSVVPALADIRCEVEIRNADLAFARQQQCERIIKVLSALRGSGVAETELQSSNIQITPIYTDNREQTEKVRFYSVSQG